MRLCASSAAAGAPRASRHEKPAAAYTKDVRRAECPLVASCAYVGTPPSASVVCSVRREYFRELRKPSAGPRATSCAEKRATACALLRQILPHK